MDVPLVFALDVEEHVIRLDLIPEQKILGCPTKYGTLVTVVFLCPSTGTS